MTNKKFKKIIEKALEDSKNYGLTHDIWFTCGVIQANLDIEKLTINGRQFRLIVDSIISNTTKILEEYIKD